MTRQFIKGIYMELRVSDGYNPYPSWLEHRNRHGVGAIIERSHLETQPGAKAWDTGKETGILKPQSPYLVRHLQQDHAFIISQ